MKSVWKIVNSYKPHDCMHLFLLILSSLFSLLVMHINFKFISSVYFFSRLVSRGRAWHWAWGYEKNKDCPWFKQYLEPRKVNSFSCLFINAIDLFLDCLLSKSWVCLKLHICVRDISSMKGRLHICVWSCIFEDGLRPLTHGVGYFLHCKSYKSIREIFQPNYFSFLHGTFISHIIYAHIVLSPNILNTNSCKATTQQTSIIEQGVAGTPYIILNRIDDIRDIFFKHNLLS